jgi:hypothetical protein
MPSFWLCVRLDHLRYVVIDPFETEYTAVIC